MTDEDHHMTSAEDSEKKNIEYEDGYWAESEVLRTSVLNNL
jgi:hypothetical protein